MKWRKSDPISVTDINNVTMVIKDGDLNNEVARSLNISNMVIKMDDKFNTIRGYFKVSWKYQEEDSKQCTADV